jgi:hypothetical protein
VKPLSFKLGKTLIPHEAISSFASFLMNNPNLQSLELNGNHWVDASQTQSPTNILKAVLHNKQSLTKLELSNLFFDEPDFIEAILATTQTLSEFSFHSSSQQPPVAYEVAQALSRGFRQNKALKTLDLRWYGPRLEDVLFALDLPRLKTLSLGAALTPESSQALIYLLKRNVTIANCTP